MFSSFLQYVCNLILNNAIITMEVNIVPFDGIVTKAVVEELQNQLTTGRLNKIYQPSETELVFTIRSQRQNFSLLFSIHPNYADRKSTRLNSSHVAISYAV